LERLKPGCEAYIQEVEAEMKCKLETVGWLPGFYSLPPNIRIASSKEYQEGKVSIEFKNILYNAAYLSVVQ